MISWWITPKNNKPKEKQFARIIIITAFIEFNKSLKKPINYFVLILPIIVSDISIAPLVADKWIIKAIPDKCWEIPVMDVCKSVNIHIHIKLIVIKLTFLFCILIVSFFYWYP